MENAPVHKIYIDGISKGKHGPAAIGVVICSPQDEPIYRISEFVGASTPEQVQFKAFVRALDEIRKLNIPFANIYSHSEMLVRQVQGIYKIMDPVIKQLKKVVNKQFGSVNFKLHLITFSQNTEATQLAEEAIRKNQQDFSASPPIRMLKELPPPPPPETATGEKSKSDVQCSAGGVLYKKEGQRFKICLIAKRDRMVWALPKGRVADKEAPEETAVREVLEETGHLARIQMKLDQIDYYFYWKENSTFYHKFVYFYLMSLEKENASQRDQEADAVIWVTPAEAHRKATYLNEKEIIRKAQKIFEAMGG